MAKTKSKPKSDAAKTKPAVKAPPRPKVRKRDQVRKGDHGGMQLVLVDDVPNLGRQGELVEVKPGYGRNYLVPRGLATVPTEENLRRLERHKIRVSAAREAKIADLKVLAEQLQRMNVTIDANANDEGHLYGSVGAAEIAKALSQRGMQVDPDMVRLEGPIKECAVYEVNISLGFDIASKVTVTVVQHIDKR
jgi:large subunit ribosomal protein L9